MLRGSSGFALRIVGLALVAGAAATGSIAAARRPTQPTAVKREPAASRARARADRCAATKRREMAVLFDPKVARRIAPSTTVHLARPLQVTPPLGPAAYVFPLPGPYPPFADTFGVPRADVPWHHGDDLFAARGTPVLAVANGVVFSVGWNRIGGWRLWLVDRSGNEFYYAHLERYSRLAVDGRRVDAGQVIGYVGTSGDAVHTPPHLFFEINPATLRHLGYDGTVDPTGYLRRWRELAKPRPATALLAAARRLAISDCR